MTDPTSTPAAITPFGGAAGVPFGATRSEVRARFGAPDRAVRSPAWAAELSDWYLEAGVVFGYWGGEGRGNGGDGGGDGGGRVDEIQLIAPSRPTVDGIDLFGAGSEAVLAQIAAAGLEVRSTLGLWEVPAWGVALFVQGDRAGERPFDAVTAFAHGPAPEPEFFAPEQPPEPLTTTEIDPRGFGPVRLGMPRARVRALLGEGMAATPPGRDPVDLHFGANVAVTYDAADTAHRICVMAAGTTATGTDVGVGQEYGHCVNALREAGVGFEEHEAEILLPDTGIRLLTARAGEVSLPVAAAVVERAPGI